MIGRQIRHTASTAGWWYYRNMRKCQQHDRVARYERLRAELSAAGSKALDVCFKEAAYVPQTCQLCQMPSNTARLCRSFFSKQVLFSGNCISCGRRLYKVVDCRGVKNNRYEEGVRERNVTCHICRNQGQFASECPEGT